MKLANANQIRALYLEAIFNCLQEHNEDVGMTASNTLNFPVVADDGEEGWVEVTVKVPKGTKDEEYDGYGRREEYRISQEEKAEKTAKRKADKAAKLAKAEARKKAKEEKEE